MDGNEAGDGVGSAVTASNGDRGRLFEQVAVERGHMIQGISATLLLDPRVIDDPYPFYRQLRAEAPVWEIPGTGLFAVSSFELVAEATGRTEDFSSNIGCLLYRDDAGLPTRLSYGDVGVQALANRRPADARVASKHGLPRTGRQAHGRARARHHRPRQPVRDGGAG